LHVDDEPSLLKIAKQLLETEGQFQVDTASTAEEAREKMKKETYDAVVSDYQMSGKDGLELLKDLRQNGSTVPFIIFTGKGREEVAIKALNLGADRYLDKNGDPETVYCELAHAINEAVERKRAQEKLRESEERFRLLFDIMVVGVVLVDRDGFVVAANQAQCSFLGYARGELIGMHFSRYLSEDGLERGLVLLSEMVEGKRDNYTADRKYKRKDSVLVWGRSSGSAVRNEEGQFKYLVAVVEDITESKKAELALSESEERFRSIVDSAAEGVVTIDADMKVVFWNKAAEKIFGYSTDEIIGNPVTVVVPLESRTRHEANMRRWFSSEMVEAKPFERRGLRKDGTEFSTEISYSFWKTEKGRFITGIVHDITERKTIERARALVLESKQKFEGLFTGNPEATVYLDQNFRILDVNPRFTSLFGYSLEEVKSKVLNDVVVPKSCMEEAKMLDGKAGEGYVYHDTVRVKKDGSPVQVSVSAAPIIIQYQLAGYIGVYKDISKLKKTEEELQKAMENVGIMNEKLRVVGGLTRHDVRNKLSTITGNTYLARKELAGNSKVSDYLKEMETAVRQVVRIFDFAKTYEMLGVEGLAYIDVERTINEATSLFSDMKSAKVLNECHGLTVLADSLLRQFFYNLMDNSLKYGKKITKIRIHYEKTGEDNLRLIYEDDGVGIPDSEKPKLFKEGFSSGGSTGYGLYLIKKMMEFYGWTIQETGITGKGAQFTITIPKKNQNGNENFQLT
jgi:PAS domain S-box-containing protein